MNTASFPRFSLPRATRIPAAFVAGLAVMLTGCNARIASYEHVDLCRVAKPVVETYLPVQAATAQDSAPSAGVCVFKVGEGKNGNRLSVVLYTQASLQSSGQTFDSIYRISIAEAGQTYGVAPSKVLADIAPQSATFSLGDSFAESYLVNKGLLLTVSAGDRALSADRGIALTREMWKALLAYRPDTK